MTDVEKELGLGRDGKDSRLRPLKVFREDLVKQRRAAAAAQDLQGALVAQAGIDLIDRALADELRVAH